MGVCTWALKTSESQLKRKIVQNLKFSSHFFPLFISKSVFWAALATTLFKQETIFWWMGTEIRGIKTGRIDIRRMMDEQTKWQTIN